jgi:hypothetical protein
LKLNYIGIVAAILAFVSLALPWWSISISLGTYSYEGSAYPWGTTIEILSEYWFGYVTLALVVVGGMLGLTGNLLLKEKGKTFLITSGLLLILSVIIYAAGLSNFLATHYRGITLFSSGPTLSTYLSVGFWLALVAAILAFVSWIKHPTPTQTQPPPKQP